MIACANVISKVVQPILGLSKFELSNITIPNHDLE